LNVTISILGCGWLGFPLAKRLIEQGCTVKGSTTTDQKLLLLRNHNIVPFLVHLKNDRLIADPDFFNSEWLIINVPPQLSKQSDSDYLNGFGHLMEAINVSPVKKVIFISSTSVYAEQAQEVATKNVVNELSSLFRSEQMVRKRPNCESTIIRFAGLIGPGRYPGRFLAGKKNVANGNSAVNLIHLYDCIGIIEALIRKDSANATYDAAAPSHPTRSEFYALAAQKANLEVPHFIDEQTAGKIINPQELVLALNYQFIYPDLMAYLHSGIDLPLP
jgi:nucleoside-diphosphate-sugar epimerase